MVFTQKFRFYMLPVLVTCALLVFLLRVEKIEAFMRFPLIIGLFAIIFIYSPVSWLFEKNAVSQEQRDRLLIKISRIIIFFMTCMLMVLLFSTAELSMVSARILATISSGFIAVLLFYKNDVIHNTLVEHWVVTAVFVGLVIFLK